MLVPTSLPVAAARPLARTSKAATPAATVSTPRSEITEANAIWQDCRLAYFGTRALFEHIDRYIPKHPREKPKDYERRSKFTRFYNAFGRTVRGVAGMPFRQRPTYGDDIPALVREQCEDIDGEGTHLDVFARQLFEDGLTTGTAGILVDAPVVEGTLSKQEEEDFGVRPYWRHVRCEEVVSWSERRINGRRTVVQLVLMDTSEALVDEFATEVQTSYRVYRLDETTGTVTTQKYERVMTEGKAEYVAIGTPAPLTYITRIPYIPLRLGLRTSTLTAITPLLDLLDTNLQHFVNSSDRNWLMHLCCFPTPVRKGAVINPAGGNTTTATGANAEAAQAQARAVADVWGGNVMLRVPTDGDFYYREPAGTAFAPTGQEIEKLEQRMAALGLAFLASDTRAAETAEAKRLDSAVQNATLAACADALDDCVMQALAVHAQFLRKAVRKTGSGVWSGGTWNTSKDYEAQLLTPQMLDAYTKMEANGQLTLRTLWKVLTKLGALPEDFDADDEEKNLTLGGDMNLPTPPALSAGAPTTPENDDPTDTDALDEETNRDAAAPVMADAAA